MGGDYASFAKGPALSGEPRFRSEVQRQNLISIVVRKVAKGMLEWRRGLSGDGPSCHSL